MAEVFCGVLFIAAILFAAVELYDMFVNDN